MSRKRPLTQLIALMMAICILFTLAPIEANAEVNCPYKRIYWVQTADSRITLASLREQVQLFSQELQANGFTNDSGGCLPIAFGVESGAQDDDIVLILDSDLDIAEQGYQVVEADNRVTVSASDTDGLFYGCRYVIKQLKLNTDGSVTSKTSAPAVLERGLSLDNGRKYFSVSWIKEMIRELSWAEMNTLVLHFSEEMGLGIESKKYPWLAGRDGTLCTQAEVTADTGVLTHDEVREIITYAKKYHVEIIPSLDSPGHMNYIVKKFNEKCATSDFTFEYGGQSYTAEAGKTDIGNYYHYNGDTSIVKGSRNTAYSRGIDISNEIAVAFTKSLIAEYAELFREAGCTKFDIGGDELLGWGSAITDNVNKWEQLDHWKTYAQNRAKAEGKSNYADAVAYDAFMYYMNDLNDMLREMKYTGIRMWNDDALRSSDTGWNGVVTLDTDIDIWYWTSDNCKSAEEYVANGYNVYNIICDYNYYAMTSKYYAGTAYAKAKGEYIYNEWKPYNFSGGGNCTSGVLGSAFAIWCDNPTLIEKEDEIMSDVLPMIRAHGAKAWDPNANTSKDYDTFTDDWEKLDSCAVSSLSAPEVETLNTVDFRTKSVRSGGTAVLRLIADSTVTKDDITLKDGSNNPITDFTVVELPNETLESGRALYIRFTVSGSGTQYYTVTVKGEVHTRSLNLWTPAQ